MEYDINNVSPRPWKKDGRDLFTTGKAFLGEMACSVLKKCPVCDANIAHIVHCVNVNDDLVAALNWALDQVAAKCKYGTDTTEYNKAEAALARARGLK